MRRELVAGLFLHDRVTHVTSRIAQTERTGVPAGTVPGLDGSGGLGPESAAISGDGKWVAFIASGAYINGPANEFGSGEVYLKPLGGGGLQRASVDQVAAQGVQAWGPLSLSDDGSRVVYTSFGSSLVAGDTNNQDDVFMYDRGTGVVTRVSVADDESEAAGASRSGVISGDGRYVVFFSNAANLTPPVADVGGGVYIRDLTAGTTREITGTGCVPPPAFGCTAGTSGSRIKVNQDGRFIAFDYGGNDLDWPADNNFSQDVYLYDAVLDDLFRISVDTTGANPDGRADTPAVSDDGSMVAFVSFATDLVTGDTNNRADPFVGSPSGAATVVRPIQAVQNRVPRSDGKLGYSLVAAKELVLRTFVRTRKSLGGPFAAFAEACLDGSVGSCPIGKSFQAVGDVYPFGTQFSEGDRRDAIDSINLVLRSGAESILTPGVHTIEVRVSPGHPGDFPVVTRRVEALFHSPRSYDLIAYPIAAKDASMQTVLPSQAVLAVFADLFRATYPVDEQTVAASVRKAEPFDQFPVAKPQRIDLALPIAKRLAEDRQGLTSRYQFAAGVVPELVDGVAAIGAGLNGFTFLDLKGVVITIDQRGADPIVTGTLPHEVGHQHGFKDEYCWDPTLGEDVLESPCPIVPGIPNPPPQTQAEGSEAGSYLRAEMLGFDVRPVAAGRTAVFGPPGPPLIGYMGFGTGADKWTTDAEYEHLYRTTTDAPIGPGVPAPASVTRTVAFVSGTIHQNGTVSLRPLVIFETDQELPGPTSGAGYAIEWLDDGDQVIDTIDFDFTFLVELLADTDSEIVEEDEVAFGFYVDLPASAETLRLRQGGTPLVELEKSANAPLVEFTSVTPQPGNEFELEWSGSDLDGDDLTYTVYYSPDGVAIQSLAVDLDITTFAFDLDDVPAVSFGAFVRVRASDGWNFAEDDFEIGPDFAVLDVDASGAVQPLSDGLLVVRHLFGFTGTTLTDDVTSGSCTRCEASAITAYLNGIATQLNVDGNLSLEPLTDGLLILRYLFGFTNGALINGAVGANCTRCESGPIVTYLGGLD